VTEANVDVPTLIREIKALPVAQERELMEAIREDLEAFEPPAYHLEVIAERVQLRNADPTRGELPQTHRPAREIEFIEVMSDEDAAEVHRLLDLDDARLLHGKPLPKAKSR
jgi:hypothetical protein